MVLAIVVSMKSEKLLDNLVKELFFKFARIEYALKASGFHEGGEGGVRANWDSFAISVDGCIENSPASKEAAEYLTKNPPKKQILENGSLAWKIVPECLNRTQNILHCVRRVRNNLFHGG